VEFASGSPSALAKNAVYVSWVWGLETDTGYNVYRSDAEGGPYAEVGSTEYPTTNYTDEDLDAGKVYWYKVAAYNDEKGEGAPSPAARSDTVGAYLSATVITNNFRSTAATANAELTDGTVGAGEVKWYKFTAAEGKTYKVQFADYWAPSTGLNPRYTGDVYVSAFSSDGNYAKKTQYTDFRHEDTGWSTAQINPLYQASGTIYLKFEPLPSRVGTFGFTVIETTN
jgi:hypothetical protein